MRELFKKKDKGSFIEGVVPVILAALAMTVVVVIFAYFMADIDKKNEVDQICRQYILEMETQGKLTDSSRAALLTDLTNAGVINIQLNETTVTEVRYGAPVVLHVTGDLKVKSWQLTGQLTDVQKVDSTLPINIRKVSTAKQ